MAGGARRFKYDVFISYAHQDAEWVRGWLLPKLEKAGVRVCSEHRDFVAGLPRLVNTENAVAQSRKTLLVLTPDWVKGEWAAFESLLMQTDDPGGRRARIVPLLLKPCDPPKRITMLTPLDLSDPAEREGQLARLLVQVERRRRVRRERPRSGSVEAGALPGDKGTQSGRGAGRPVDRVTRYDPGAALPFSQYIEDPSLTPVREAVPGGSNLVRREIIREPYLVDAELAEAVNLAILLRRPLLLQGEPGCGKTRLAYAVAYALGWPLEECYMRSTTRVQDLLYTYDSVRRLMDAQLVACGPMSADGRTRSEQMGDYVSYGPLGRAIVRAQYGRPSLVLVDEIDKGGSDFPGDLLSVLDRLEFVVQETRERYAAPSDNPSVWPVVFVTSNEDKPLPETFLRRCIYHRVDFPHSEEEVVRILALHGMNDANLGMKAFRAVQSLRRAAGDRVPGLRELLDFVAYLQATGVTSEQVEEVVSPQTLAVAKRLR